MNYKKWLFVGITLVLVSLIIGFFGPIWGIYNAFSAMKSNEGAAGIGVVSSALNEGLFSTIIAFFGFLIGLIFITIAVIKGHKISKSEN